MHSPCRIGFPQGNPTGLAAAVQARPKIRILICVLDPTPSYDTISMRRLSGTDVAYYRANLFTGQPKQSTKPWTELNHQPPLMGGRKEIVSLARKTLSREADFLLTVIRTIPSSKGRSGYCCLTYSRASVTVVLSVIGMTMLCVLVTTRWGPQNEIETTIYQYSSASL